MINYFKNRRIRLEAEAAKVKAQIDEYERVCKLEVEYIKDRFIIGNFVEIDGGKFRVLSIEYGERINVPSFLHPNFFKTETCVESVSLLGKFGKINFTELEIIGLDLPVAAEA